MSDDPHPAHPGEEELILHYYGEDETGAAVEAHLAECAACGTEWAALSHALDAVRDEEGAGPADPTAEDVARMWNRLAPHLPGARRRRTWQRMLPSLAAAAALFMAFLLGRHWAVPPAPAPVEAHASERILLLAVGDHLERSQMLLIELANAPTGKAPLDIGVEQGWAQELVGANRLYRQAAAQSGEPAVASVLDELERLLVEVAHGPASLDADDLARLQRRIESRGLLFKVRVLESRVRSREKQDAPSGVRGFGGAVS
jgi:hypothetical protein